MLAILTLLYRQTLPVGAAIFVTAQLASAVTVQDKLLIKDSETQGGVVGEALGEVERVPLLRPIIVRHDLLPPPLFLGGGTHENLVVIIGGGYDVRQRTALSVVHPFE